MIGTDYPWRANKAALVLAPTGVALGDNGTLYVGDTESNTISAITHAITRTGAAAASATTISSGGSLNAPLGMMSAPNGDLIVVNGNNGNAVEVSPAGKQLITKTLVKKGAGDLFGLTASATGDGILLVNDGTNALTCTTTEIEVAVMVLRKWWLPEVPMLRQAPQRSGGPPFAEFVSQRKR